MAALPGISNWKNKIALVTGGSIGIGAAICKTLTESGLIVIGCARDKSRMDDLATECNGYGFSGKLHSYQCDMSKEKEIETMFEWIKIKLGGVDVCINNCGFTIKESLLDASVTQMRELLDVNILALSICTSKAVGSMRERNVDGHIININSILGKQVEPIFNFYSGTKFAVTALTEGLRLEIGKQKLKIRVTGIHPGMVESQFIIRAYGETVGRQIYDDHSPLSVQDVADAVLYALSAPLNVQIEDITLQSLNARNAKF